MSLAVRIKPPSENAATPARNRAALALASATLADAGPRAGVSSVSPVVLSGLVRLGDVCAVCLTGYAIAVGYVAEPGIATSVPYIACIAFAAAMTVAALAGLGLYALRAYAALTSHAPRLLLGWMAAFSSLLAAIFLFKSGADFSRVWLSAWFLAAPLALVGERLIVATLMRRFAREGRISQRIAIYGSGVVAEELIAHLEDDDGQIVRICGVFDDRDRARAPCLVKGYPRLGGIDDLIAMSRAQRFDIVVVALPLNAEGRLADVVDKLSVLPVDIKMPARATRLRFARRTYSYVGSVAMIDLHDRPLAGWQTVSKWLFDKIIGATALLLLAPVMALVALAVKLDSRGPVLFRQKRYGFNNELIEVFKFRSMYTDRCDATASKLVTRDDPRVTRVGRIIRKTSLDELPQLFNVILGELSLVGPRPHAVEAKAGSERYDDAVAGYFARHKVKPGITGWAQINGWRGETDTREKIEKRVEHDLYYIENWSLLLDLSILARTPASLLKTESAY